MINMRATGLLLLGALAELGSATYILEDDYQPNTWFDQFRFFSVCDTLLIESVLMYLYTNDNVM